MRRIRERDVRWRDPFPIYVTRDPLAESSLTHLRPPAKAKAGGIADRLQKRYAERSPRRIGHRGLFRAMCRARAALEAEARAKGATVPVQEKHYNVL